MSRASYFAFFMHGAARWRGTIKPLYHGLFGSLDQLSRDRS
jgi:hypothetical protein